ncbi:MAG TPA: tRNA 4-thiouridine(8) synthase ThiI [Anaerolineae bacterium]|nr:tRNA 4-thiouridine(8) synthase ThiI [Anaerolineae bacterium]HID83733.1 tRNA 4-thiouridine(8) synthase ThiI [Anaerolineales bacterium]HIQ08642.1 tRNA 4-thiouridine(8) synthase ThiI [Anaerolineaceae bacterium]
MVIYLVHYSSEIGLKGKNRRDFIDQLRRNIRRQLKVHQVEHLMGRLVVEDERPDLDFGKVFGVAWWAKAVAVPPDIEAIKAEAVRQALAHPLAGGKPTFAVRANRADKTFLLNSMQIEREVGAAVVVATGWKVNLRRPDLTIQVEVAPGRVFVFGQKQPGHQGLPVGTAGRAVGLFSGGIDSVMAAWLMARRGAEVALVHFHAFVKGEQAHREKVGRLAERLGEYIPGLKVYYVPYYLFQIATAGLKRRTQRYELVVFRRFMARAAERIARQMNAQVIFTGDSLGQVASQTLGNMVMVDRAVDLPVFRPLVAWNKQEIIDLGERLGFYEIAKQPYKDCCSIISTHPATRPNPEAIAQMEAELGVEALLTQTLEETEVFAY